jgi:hypothetical protein
MPDLSAHKTKNSAIKVFGKTERRLGNRQTMVRSIKACMNCGETREIAAHGLCFTCYRREERKLVDDLWTRPDPAAKELAKTQRKTRKALMKMMDALEEIESGKLVPQETIEAWRKLLRPEVERIALSLGEAQVNGEHENVGEPFTALADEPSEQVNSEQESGSVQFTQLSQPVPNLQTTANERVAESTSLGSKPVNGEHATASEPVHSDSYKLPPTIQQYRKKINQTKSKTNGKAEGDETKV